MEPLDQMVPLDLKVPRVHLDTRDLQGWWVFLDSEEYQAQLVKKEEEAILVFQDLKVLQEKWENGVHRELLALQDHQERQEAPEMLASQEHLGNPELLDQWESEALLDHRACRVFQVPQEFLECLA